MGCCYRPRDVAWSVCLSVCWSRPWALQTRLNRSTCRLGAKTRVGPRNHYTRSTLATPGKYERVMCVAATMWAGRHYRTVQLGSCGLLDDAGTRAPFEECWKIINSELGRFMSLFVVFVQWTYFSGLCTWLALCSSVTNHIKSKVDLYRHTCKSYIASELEAVRIDDVFYWNGFTDWAGCWYTGFRHSTLHCFIKKIDCFQNKGIYFRLEVCLKFYT